VIRTRLQVTESKEMESISSLASRMLQEEGVSSFFAGWSTQVQALAASNFVYFYQYNGLKAVVKKLQLRNGGSADIGTGTNLAIATVAGVINVFATTPFWVVSTRMAVQRNKGSDNPYTGMVDGLTRIAKEEGVMALWNGTLPSLLLVSNPSIQFVTYERVRRWMTARSEARGTKISVFEFFLMGAFAKLIATVCTYPVQLAQSRLRAMKSKSQDQKKVKYQYTGTLDVLMKVLENDGPLGLFRGMEAKIYQTVGKEISGLVLNFLNFSFFFKPPPHLCL
jgi:adenine nucleotide transporter 17